MGTTLSPLAVKLLDSLGASLASEALEIGGGIALWHYSPHRQTNDIDLWWSEASDLAAEAIERSVVEVAGAEGLDWMERVQQGYPSWDLKSNGKTVFAIQVAVKRVQIYAPVASRWGHLKLETLAENVANKMCALVQRAAPRDFVDIATLLKGSAISPQECWRLWQLKNPQGELKQAKVHLLKGLGGLTARRPIDSIQDLEERIRASETRDLISKLAQV